MDDDQQPSASPSPSPRARPSSGGAGSSPASEAAASSAPPFVGNPGPAFDPDDAAAPADAAATPAAEQLGQVELVEWDADRMRRALQVQGMATHGLLGARDAHGARPGSDWLWTPGELDAAAPAFAALANRFPTTRAAAAVSDELGAGMALFSYATRSLGERARVLRLREQQESQVEPATGRAPDTPHPGTFGPLDFEYVPPGAAAAADPAGDAAAAAADAERVRVEPAPLAHRNGRRVRAAGEQPLPNDLTIHPATPEDIPE